MKRYLYLIIAILIMAVVLLYHQAVLYRNNWSVSEANVKAYSNELSTSKEKNTALQLTVEQLSYFNDSVLQALDNTRKELKIKDKNLKALQSVTSEFTKMDTIVLKDTIFKEPSLAVDTLLGDEWYNVRVGLHYPSIISVNPSFKSEKHIVVSTKKETINPPKKFFLARWFQRKHKVLKVNVVEMNPYVENEESKYIEILK